jgi:hypothetical protein
MENTIFWDVRPFGRPRHGWENNIKVVLKEIWWKNGTGLIWIRIIKSGGLL